MVRSLADFLGEEEPERRPLEEIFAEEPVPLDVFVQDFKFLNNPPLSPKQYEAVQHIERIYLPETYPQMAEAFGGYWSDPVRMTNLITLQWGKGSGKDHICRISSLRVAYLLLCLKSPQEYFGMPAQDSIHLLNIASNAQQANRAFFKPMTEAVKRSWFKDKAEPKRDTIIYANNIEAVSGHSEAEGQEGLNLLLGVADEIDAFKAKDEMIGQGNKLREASTSAESILDMLKTSASTRFPENYKRVAISFPRYLGSTIQKLTDQAHRDNAEYPDSRHYVSGPWATWEVNPRVKGKHQFVQDYRDDPNAAAAKYECRPTRAIDAYFRNMLAIRSCVTEEKQPITVTYELQSMRSSITGESGVNWEPKFHIDWSQLKPIQGANYAMHADLAIKGDRAGIAMSHVKRWEERKQTIWLDDSDDDEPLMAENTVRVPIVKNDFTIYFEADIGESPAREIQIKWARQLAFELRAKGFHITYFTFDGFQSADSIQILNNHGIESDRFSLDRKDDGWKTLRDLAYDGRLEFPFEQLLINELESLSRVKGKVDHPPGGSKDLADAFAGSLVGAIEVGGEEDADGQLVDVGVSKFDVGPALAQLEGFDMLPPGGLSEGLGLPAGMRGMKYGA